MIQPTTGSAYHISADPASNIRGEPWYTHGELVPYGFFHSTERIAPSNRGIKHLSHYLLRR